MSNFYTLNLKALVCTAIATIPTLLLINGLDDAVAQAVAQAQIHNQSETTTPMQLAQLSDVTGKTVLVD